MLRVCSYAVCAIALLFTTITKAGSTAKTNHIMKRDAEGKFGMLLNLYKINPLRQSKIFKAFSNRMMLMPNRADRPVAAVHIDSNESTKERQTRTKLNFKQIEEAIHVTQHRHKELERPSFVVHDDVPERFSGELLTLGDISRYKKYKAKKDDKMFKNIFKHKDSNKNSYRFKDAINAISTNTVSVKKEDQVIKGRYSFKPKGANKARSGKTVLVKKDNQVYIFEPKDIANQAISTKTVSVNKDDRTKKYRFEAKDDANQAKSTETISDNENYLADTFEPKDDVYLARSTKTVSVKENDRTKKYSFESKDNANPARSAKTVINNKDFQVYRFEAMDDSNQEISTRTETVNKHDQVYRSEAMDKANPARSTTTISDNKDVQANGIVNNTDFSRISSKNHINDNLLLDQEVDIMR